MKNIGNTIGLYPTPDTVVGTVIDGRVNWMNVAHVGMWGIKKMVISIGKPHYTNIGLLENRTMSINMVDENMLVRADYVGIVTGEDTDKSGVFDYFSGELKNAPLIREAPLAMECTIDEIIEIPTHYNYIVTPVNTYAREDILSPKGKIDYTRYHPVLFEMPLARYLRTGDAIGDCWRIGRDMKEKIAENNENQNKGGSVFAVPEEKTAYAIITVKIKDREKFMEYVKGHIPSVLQYGGKFRFEGIAVEDIENSAFAGDRSDLVVIQEWPAKENFYEWWNSEEYKPWKEMRPQGADVTVTLTEQRGNNI
jgi:flavin reductase (DIM6/NTAB) family NADH-FMN oxidoreductase RutF/uncharacterized protein (DUF1330 family)